jgi:hypothetical protein
MRDHPHLPRTFRRPGKDSRLILKSGRFQGAVLYRFTRHVPVAQDYPALRDGIFSEFHAVIFSKGYRQAMSPRVVDGSMALERILNEQESKKNATRNFP